MLEEELEVKFCIKDLSALEKRLRSLDASLAQTRVHEINLRFDTPDGLMMRTQQVLRLRMDKEAMLTYKGPSQDREDVTARREIEVVVSDFSAARRLLEALGYRVVVTYEKYRTTYLLDALRITLDEMPYGDFIEIEGPDPLEIQRAAERLSLDWSARVMDSYLAMFGKLPNQLTHGAHDLTFANFQGLQVTPADLGIRTGD